MMTEAASITFKKYFFNGDHGTDVDGFEGVRKRLSNMPSRQRVHLGDGGDEAWDALAGTAEALEFIDKFEQFIYRCNNGDVKFISGNEGMVWGIGRVLRYLQVSGGTGLLDVTKINLIVKSRHTKVSHWLTQVFCMIKLPKLSLPLNVTMLKPQMTQHRYLRYQ